MSTTMRKEELIATHELLFEVSKFIHNTGTHTDFSEYNALNIGPKSVHYDKNAHEEAVTALLNGIDESINTDQEPNTAITA